VRAQSLEGFGLHQNDGNADSRLNLLDISAPDPFASHRQMEPYPGYYEQLARDRQSLNDQLTGFFSSAQKLLGWGVGVYGIFGSAVKSRRKWLTPPDGLVHKLMTPAEEQQLARFSQQIRSLRMPGHDRALALLAKQASVIERNVLTRSRLHAFGGLGLGLGASQLVDRCFFSHDTVGDGSAFAELIACPLLAWRVPGNFAVKAAAVAAASLAGRIVDHISQPHYFYDPRDQNAANLPMSQVNQFRMPWCDIPSRPLCASTPSREALVTTAPGATPLPVSLFNDEDRRCQRENRQNQERMPQGDGGWLRWKVR
jgi:hypothetical protein